MMTYGVRQLLEQADVTIRPPSRKHGRRSRRVLRPDWVVSVGGILSLDAGGARLHDRDGEESVPLADLEAYAALRASLPPGDYLGDALLLTWVRAKDGGPELHTVFEITLGDFENVPPQWGPHVTVRPVPLEYQYH